MPACSPWRREMSLRSPARRGAQPGELGLSSASPAPWAGPLPPGVTKGPPGSGCTCLGCLAHTFQMPPVWQAAGTSVHSRCWHSPRLCSCPSSLSEPEVQGGGSVSAWISGAGWAGGAHETPPLGPGAPAPQQGLLGTCPHAAEDALLGLPYAPFLPAFSPGMSRRQTAGQEETRVSTCGH